MLVIEPVSPYWAWFESVFWIIMLVIILIVAYFIIKEIRLMRNTGGSQRSISRRRSST